MGVKVPFSAASAMTIFLAVLLCGTVWRLTSLHLAASESGGAKTLGQAMAFQY
jgi:hypothetical protein